MVVECEGERRLPHTDRPHFSSAIAPRARTGIQCRNRDPCLLPSVA